MEYLHVAVGPTLRWDFERGEIVVSGLKLSEGETKRFAHEILGCHQKIVMSRSSETR